MTGPRLPIVLVLAGLLAACQSEVYRGLNQRDANAMLALLTRNGIEAKRETVDATTYRITVPEKDVTRAIDLLRAAGLPRESFQSFGEVFRGDGLVVSPYEQRVRMMFAQNQELTRTITGIDGVVSARVHVVVPELDLRGQPQTKPTASVAVHYRPGVDTSELAAKIRAMVANGVQGLAYRDVSLSFFTAQELAGADLPMPASAAQRASALQSGPAQASREAAAPTAFRPPQLRPARPAEPIHDPADTGLIQSVRRNAALGLWGLAGLSALAGLVMLVLSLMGPEATGRIKLGKKQPQKAREA
jgi:type III secretion protein J